MDLEKYFRELVGAGLAGSQAQFSTVWLGRSYRYYSSLLAHGREPSVGTLCALHMRVKWVLCQTNNHVQAKTLSALDTALAKEIEERCLMDGVRLKAKRAQAGQELALHP